VLCDSGQHAAAILRWHLVPTPGPKRLDAIPNEQVQRLKLALSNRAPKTLDNVVTVPLMPGGSWMWQDGGR